jgi:hypothetical protein
MYRRLLQSVLVSAILAVSSFAQDPAPILLFSSSDTGSPVPPILAAEKGVKRIRPIHLNSQAVDPTTSISGEAFSNVTLNVQWNKAVQADKNGTVILSGTVENKYLKYWQSRADTPGGTYEDHSSQSINRQGFRVA